MISDSTRRHEREHPIITRPKPVSNHVGSLPVSAILGSNGAGSESDLRAPARSGLPDRGCEDTSWIYRFLNYDLKDACFGVAKLGAANPNELLRDIFSDSG